MPAQLLQLERHLLLSVGRADHKARLDLTVKRFEEILNIKIGQTRETFSGFVNFGFLSSARVNGQYLIGEAAAFQDQFAAFGMTYAFKSGYLAARSIIENLDYDALWKKDFLRQLTVSATNRRLYEKLSNNGHERLIRLLMSRNPFIRRLRGGDDLKKMLRKLYNHSFSYVIRPFVFR